ncbi:MAG: 4Fe-4S binding protein [Treponema sp.]|nr:4Fe-4S binding protein [Treponema sp.]
MSDALISLTPVICTGGEDKFYYTISNDCIRCGSCMAECPVGSILQRDNRFHIDKSKCIDCGT